MKWLFAFYISLTFGKGMNPTIFALTIGKIAGQIWLFKLSMVTDFGEAKLRI